MKARDQALTEIATQILNFETLAACRTRGFSGVPMVASPLRRREWGRHRAGDSVKAADIAPGCALRVLMAFDLASGSRPQGKHPFHVPGQGHQSPLALDVIEPAQQELAESHHRFDDAKHRFRGLLAQSVEFFAFGRP